ncbi:MAG TPA: diaminopimelate decarboxylase [Candidatus Sulfopaludibacter sp.]|nr:diaminopimelate decarboxylase [Terriglobia bacterium]HEV2444716.1 diaminopimelate decarboxylase [Candidatus Sulfopaludibacter sp.]
MDRFHYRGGELFCEDVALGGLAAQFGTPLYVYSASAILDNLHRLERALARLPHEIAYSVKANSNLRILRLLKEAGAGFDIVSGGELARVMRVGAPPESVVFSGVGKTAAEVDAALAAAILMFNVESAGELEMIDRRAAALGATAGIALRLNPDVAAATHPYVSTGRAIHKFGVAETEALELYRRAAASPRLRVRGIACHIGSQILEVRPFLEALDQLLGLAARLQAEGINIECLDIGGGFGIAYGQEAPLDFESLGRALEARLQGTPYRLVVEPGRRLVGDAGLLLARVLDVKRQAQKNFVVVDAGMNDLIRPALYGSYHEILPVVESAARPLRADVVGPLCETGDFLAQDRDLPEVSAGDLLAALTAGAYGYALASNYNARPRPAEVLVEGTSFELIRRRESFDDLIATELIH